MKPKELSDRMVKIANRMMKGPTEGHYLKGTNPEDRKLFTEKYRSLIEEILPHLPTIGSAAIGAVICKCAIKYGREIAIRLADEVKNGVFTNESVNDPAKRLWQFVLMSRGESSVRVYRIAVTACRAYCEGRTLTELTPAKTDIFEWTKDWDVGVKYRKSHRPKEKLVV